MLKLLAYWRITLASAAVLAASHACFYAKGRQDGWNAHKADETRRIEAARRIDTASKAVAEAQRVKDTAKVSEHHKELTDADNAVPDSVPSDARRALACARLRQQTRDPRQLPAECRPGG